MNEQTVGGENSTVVETQTGTVVDTQAGTETIDISKENFVDPEGIEKAGFNSILLKEEVKPQMFLEENSQVRIDIEVLSDRKTGKIISVFKKGALDFDDIKDVFCKTYQWFEFTIPSFEDVSFYRQRSSVNQQRLVDKNLFRNFIIAKHLKDWSLENDGKKIELDFEFDGNLSKESIRFVNRVPTIIWDVALTAFERETLIS